MQATFGQLHYPAVLAAAISTFLVGGLWYNVFEKPWMAANGFTGEYLQHRKPLLVFGGAFLLSAVMALNLAMFLGPASDLRFGLLAGFAAGFGWVLCSLGIISLFERRGLRYTLINGGYMVVAFTVMGAILGGWH